jgi:hypothetical protein
MDELASDEEQRRPVPAAPTRLRRRPAVYEPEHIPRAPYKERQKAQAARKREIEEENFRANMQFFFVEEGKGGASFYCKLCHMSIPRQNSQVQRHIRRQKHKTRWDDLQRC